MVLRRTAPHDCRGTVLNLVAMLVFGWLTGFSFGQYQKTCYWPWVVAFGVAGVAAFVVLFSPNREF